MLEAIIVVLLFTNAVLTRQVKHWKQKALDNQRRPGA